MPDLFDRLFDEDVGDIPVHTFEAAIVDYIAGETTRNQIVAAWSLDASAQTDLDVLLTAVDALVGLDDKLRFIAELNAVNNLAEADLKYNTKATYRTRLSL